MLKLFGLSPRPQALQAEAVIAAGHDTEPGLWLWLLHDDFHADAASPVFRLGNAERVLHVCFETLHTSLE